MKVRQKVNKVTKSGKPPTSWLGSRERERERSRVRWNDIYADKTKHDREKLRDAERKKITYDLEAMIWTMSHVQILSNKGGRKKK